MSAENGADSAPTANRRRQPRRYPKTGENATVSSTITSARTRNPKPAKAAAAPASSAPLAAAPVLTDIFIKKLPNGTEKDAVRALAAAFGNILKLSIVKKKDRPVNSRVSYETAASATSAIAKLNNSKVGNATIQASIFVKRPKNATIVTPAPAPAAAAVPNARKVAVKTTVVATENVAAVVYVGNIPEGSTEDEVKALFNGFTIVNFSQRRSVAFVTLASAEEAVKAIAANGASQIKGTVVVVEPRKPIKAKRLAATTATGVAPKERQKAQKQRSPINTNSLKVWVGRLQPGYDVTKLAALFVGVLKIDQHDACAYLTLDKEENSKKAVAKNGSDLFGDGNLVKIEVARKA